MSNEVQIENMQKFAEPEEQELTVSSEEFDFSQYVVHPLIADYPEMNEKEFLDFHENVRLNGLIDPIIVTKNKEIIDGRIRYEACKATKQLPHFQIQDIYENEIQLFWISKNLHRNHLGLFQRACLAAEVDEHYSEKIKAGKAIKISKRRRGIPLSEEEMNQTLTRDYLKKLYRVNTDYYQTAKHLKKYEPELFLEFKSGKKEKASEAIDILNNNVEYLLNVPLKSKYITFKNLNCEFSDNDKTKFEYIKTSKRNLKVELEKILDQYIEHSNSESISTPQSKIKKMKLSDLGENVANNVAHNIETKTNQLKIEASDAEKNEVLNSLEDESQQRMIQEFDNVDTIIKLRIVKLAHTMEFTTQDYLLFIANKAA